MDKTLTINAKKSCKLVQKRVILTSPAPAVVSHVYVAFTRTFLGLGVELGDVPPLRFPGTGCSTELGQGGLVWLGLVWLGPTDNENDDCMDKTLTINAKKSCKLVQKRVILTSPAPAAVSHVYVAFTRTFLGLGDVPPLRFPTN
jgi:hypothetical protein